LWPVMVFWLFGFLLFCLFFTPQECHSALQRALDTAGSHLDWRQSPSTGEVFSQVNLTPKIRVREGKGLPLALELGFICSPLFLLSLWLVLSLQPHWLPVATSGPLHLLLLLPRMLFV
jgi:hypothetical protein